MDSKLLLIFALLGICYGAKTLVLLDDLNIQETHSIFLDSLRARGHDLTVEHVYSDLKLGAYGEFFYDNLVLFCPSAEDFGEAIKTEHIVAFIDSGRNVLVAANENVTEPIRELANECGVDFDESQTQVVDHFNFDAADASYGNLHTLVAANVAINNPVIIGKSPSAPVLFRGIGHATSDNPKLVYKLLTASEVAYSANAKKRVDEYPQSAGRDTLLVSAIQARNNARVVFSGSLDLFSNKFFSLPVNAGGQTAKKSGNEEFAIELSKWNFQERGLLRASQLTHYKTSEPQNKNPTNYRIKDDIHFSVLIEEYDGASKSWVPFKGNDVQLEFVMLDPYVRKTLQHDGKGHYSLDFKAPDVYGVFKFVVHYEKQGYSNLEVSTVVPVHPYRHNEFERFIDVAYPYYAASFTLMAGFVFFGYFFLFSKD